MKNGFRRVLFVVFLLGKGLNATITQRPLNAVAEIGEQVRLGCTADSGIGYWVLSKNGDVNSELEIVGPGCSALNAAFVDHYAVELLNGGKTCNLIIFNITMEQAGVYRCIQASLYAFSILTVMDSSPNITVNSTMPAVENESIKIACSLRYNGSVEPAATIRPYFNWTDFNGQHVSSSYDSTTNITALSQLTLTAGRQNITSCTCHVNLQLIPSTNSGYTNNTPTVSKSASSPTIEVLYYPENMRITSSVSTTDKCVYKLENLTCAADANPPAQYEWLDLINNIVTGGSVKSITTGGLFKCTAYNYIRNQIHNKMKTTLETSCCLKPGEAVGIAIGCILVINVLATCLFIGCYNKGEALHPGTNAGTESAKTERNKMTLNKKFSWLQKMLPCLNNTKENTGNNCLWISLFILVATLTMCVTFPIWILLTKKFGKSQESSALNKRENGDENESTENGRRPANSSLSPSQSMNPESAMRSEGPTRTIR